MDKLAALLASKAEPFPVNKEAYLRELRNLLETPGYTTDKSVLTQMEQEMEKPKAEQPSEEELGLLLLCEDLTKALGKTNETFMLSAPLALTVKKPNGAYSKAPHIGSEDFSPKSAYLGKRGKIIFVFKPIMVTDYAEMEMEESQAMANLMGFKEWVRENVGDLQQRIQLLRSETAKKAEQEKLADRFETYKDLGFGSW